MHIFLLNQLGVYSYEWEKYQVIEDIEENRFSVALIRGCQSTVLSTELSGPTNDYY